MIALRANTEATDTKCFRKKVVECEVVGPGRSVDNVMIEGSQPVEATTNELKETRKESTMSHMVSMCPPQTRPEGVHVWPC